VDKPCKVSSVSIILYNKKEETTAAKVLKQGFLAEYDEYVSTQI